jgi:hypothetical protein
MTLYKFWISVDERWELGLEGGILRLVSCLEFKRRRNGTLLYCIELTARLPQIHHTCMLRQRTVVPTGGEQ